jgi:hypothetical protein
VEILRRTGDCHLEISDPTQTVGDSGRASIHPVIVRLNFCSRCQRWLCLDKSRTYDADAIDAIKPPLFPFGELTFDQVVEAFASTLFHAFEAEAEIDGEIETKRLVRFEDMEPSEDGTLII